jgi:hypothetical protein
MTEFHCLQKPVTGEPRTEILTRETFKHYEKYAVTY